MHQGDDCVWCVWFCVRACVCETYTLQNSAAKASYRHVSILIFVLEAHILSVEPVNVLTSLLIIYPKQGVKVTGPRL